MQRRRWLYGLAFAFGLLLLLGTRQPAAARKAPVELENEALRISRDLYCPVCPGVSPDVCETQACPQWRALIREKLAAGFPNRP